MEDTLSVKAETISVGGLNVIVSFVKDTGLFSAHVKDSCRCYFSTKKDIAASFAVNRYKRTQKKIRSKAK